MEVKMKNELNRPRMGIDKISVALNPFYLADNIPFNKKGLYSLDSYNYVILKKHGNYFIELQINQEGFEPNLDYKCQIISYLLVLLRKGLFKIENNAVNRCMLIMNYNLILLSTIGLEFYIDCKYKDIQVQEELTKKSMNEAKDAEGLFCFENTKNQTKTFYSHNFDGKKKIASSICIYDKRSKDLHDNHFSKDSIMKHKYPLRIEFRIYSSNSDWLNMDNLKGSSRIIFNRYLEYLAYLYNKFLLYTVEFKTNGNPELCKIVTVAGKQTHYSRFRSNRLKTRKNEPIKNWCKAPFNELIENLSLKKNTKKKSKLNDQVMQISRKMRFQSEYYFNEENAKK